MKKVLFILFLFLSSSFSLETVTVDTNANIKVQEKKVKNQFYDFIMEHPEIVEVKKNSVELREFNGLSLFSTREIEQGEIILQTNLTNSNNFISKRKFLNYAKNLPEELTKTLPQNAVIALLILYEKYKCSPSNETLWKKYILDIEERFPNYYSLLLYSDKDLEEFQNSISKYLITMKLDEMADYLSFVKFRKLYQYLDFGKDCSSNWDELLTSIEWIWAYTFSTRTFNINSKFANITDELTIIPFVDFLNTAPNPNVGIADEKEGSFALIATRKIKENEELTLQYPSINNYMSHYGFCMENNQHSYYSFMVVHFLKDMIKKKFKNEEDFSQFEEILKKLKPIHFIHLKKDSKLSDIPQDLYSLIRLVHLENYSEFISNPDDFFKGMNGKRFNFENEINMLNSLLDLFKSTLLQYKTTLEEDEELLKKKIENYKVYCAVIIRRDEKIILNNIIEQIEEVLKYSDELKNPKYYEI
eukprot:gene1836-978_t